MKRDMFQGMQIISLCGALSYVGCAMLSGLPNPGSTEARVYQQRCSTCHAIPHPGRIDYGEWADRIVVMNNLEMPVITEEERQIVLEYLFAYQQGKIKLPEPKTYSLRCGACHVPPDPLKLNLEEWREKIRVLNGAMPVFSAPEKEAVLTYLGKHGRNAPRPTPQDPTDPYSLLAIRKPVIRKEAPSLRLLSLSEQTVSLDQYRGKVVLLHFWATWCKPCRQEVPDLVALGETMKQEHFQILAVSADRSPSKVREFVEEFAMPFPVLLDTQGEARNAYVIEAFPTTYIIGKDGKFLGRVEGVRNWNQRRAKEFFLELARQ